MPLVARAAACTVSRGTSSCSSSTAARRTDSTSASSGVSSAFAPGTTTIRFSPLPSSTGIVADPVGTPRGAEHPADVDPRAGQRGELTVAGGVLADPADHVHAPAETPGGGGLVGTLAARGDLDDCGR